MLRSFPVSFDSSHINANSRREFCREEFGRKALHVDMEIPKDQPFRMRMGGASFGDVRVSVIESTSLSNFRNRQLIADGDDDFGAVIPLVGRYTGEQAGSNFSVVPGGITAMASHLEGVLSVPNGGAFLTVLAPWKQIMQRAGIDPPIGEVRKPAKASLNLLKAYVRGAVAHGGELSADGRAMVGRHLVELLGLVFSDEEPCSTIHGDPVNLMSQRLVAVKADIAENFADPAYSVAVCAANLELSVRYVQSLLEGDGTSFSAQLKRHRLERAWALLSDPTNRSWRVIDVALESGFNDVSNFNRLFRNRYGETPSGIRLK